MITFLLHGYGEFSPRQPLKAVRWPHFDLLFVHRGRLPLNVHGLGPVELHTGEAILLYPDTLFEPLAPRSAAHASVQHFSLDRTAESPPPFNQLVGKRDGGVVLRGKSPDHVQRDVERALAWARLPATPERHAMREALLTLILGEILRIGWEGGPGDGVRDSSSLLQWASHQPLDNFRVSTLARAAGVSESTLRRRFSREGETAPGDSILQLRMNLAKRLLCETGMPLKEIADRVGYGGPIAFNHAFKREHGLPPGAFRKQNRIRG